MGTSRRIRKISLDFAEEDMVREWMIDENSDGGKNSWSLIITVTI